MATKKSVGTMQQHRNKEGLLELEKTKGLKKTWKSYTFKVSASTYLLCFKSDFSNPERKLLLAEVLKVLPAACHGARFPFEVHFRGKGSPWKLNAGSNEERIGWMEAILPGSSSSITRFQHLPETPSPPLPTGNPSITSLPHYSLTETTPTRKTTLGHHSSSLGADPRYRADPNPYIDVPKLSSPGGYLMSDEEDYTFLTASLTTPTNPAPKVAEAYLVPSESPTPGTSAQGPKIHAPPRHSSSDGEVMKPRRPRPRPRTPRASPAPSATPDDSDYIKMMSSPVRKRELQATASEGELPQYLEVVGGGQDPTLDEGNYVIPDSPTDQRKPSISLHSPVGRADSSQGVESGGGASGNLVDTISKHFNKDQIGMLIQMLQEVRVDKGQTAEDEAKAWEVRTPPTPSTPTAYGNEDSITLRGHLSRALSYAPAFSDGILVTEEDSDESYERRPQWAKAVAANGQPAAQPEQLDTLSDLQQEALYIAKKDIKELRVIGQGQFGEVFKGVLSRGVESMPVAVKMTKKTISEYLQESFMKEMSIMSQMMHPNIVRLYGVVSEDVPSPWIVLEFMENGDIKSFLTKNKRSSQQLVKYMVDVAMGMHYISERGLVHRDLAARNVLVGASEICKVADFGLLREIPRDLSVYTASHSIPCPIRWMPPESISNRQFSAASDVWSFGILVWEMFNPTKLPFEKYDNMAVVSKVNEGLRLPIPRGAPSIVAKIMKACWHRNPNKRPSFLLISTLLSTRTIF